MNSKEFLCEVVANKEQWKEWQRLGFVQLSVSNEQLSDRNLDRIDQAHDFGIAFNGLAEANAEGSLFPKKTPTYFALQKDCSLITAHCSLILDTKFFDQKFKDRLLAALADVEQNTDGLLVQADNFHALNLMAAGNANGIQCIHIDPPYNTQTSGFLYKNNYQHSSWLAMMEARINASVRLLAKDGAYQCHIDENEYEVLYQLFERTCIPNAGTVVWDKRNPMNAGRGVATQHEYLIWRSFQDSPIYLQNTGISEMLRVAAEIVQRNGGVTEKARKEYVQWVDPNAELTGGEKAYRFMDDHGHPYQSVSLRAPEPRTDLKFHKPLIHPVTQKPCPVPPNGFSRTPETLHGMIDRGEILFGLDETIQPRQKVLLTENTKRQVSSLIQDARKGKADVSPLGLDFAYCHPVSLYETLLGAGLPNRNDIVLDYFAGSGTTAHDVINLNREDGGKRKYILVEMGDYFDTVLKPRIQKVVYSKEWKNGKPVNRDTGVSHIFKYIRLESYEDALANIRLKRTEAQHRALFSSASSASSAVNSFRESYLLRYMLDAEAKGSPSLLDLDRFDDPFSYQLLVGAGSVGETKPVNVDLVETFNWLLGLKVKHIDAFWDKKTGRQGDGEKAGTPMFRIVEGMNPKGEKVLVIWRKIRDLTAEGAEGAENAEKITKEREEANTKLDEFFKQQHYNTMDSEFDVIYVNGDNNLMNIPMAPEGEGREPRYKVRLIEEEFKRLMFEVKDV
ncbi:MAG: site-specific DNA-methyltransferase [Planctomycetota bacterium]